MYTYSLQVHTRRVEFTIKINTLKIVCICLFCLLFTWQGVNVTGTACRDRTYAKQLTSMLWSIDQCCYVDVAKHDYVHIPFTSAYEQCGNLHSQLM